MSIEKNDTDLSSLRKMVKENKNFTNELAKKVVNKMINGDVSVNG